MRGLVNGEKGCRGATRPIHTPIFLPTASPPWIDFQSVGFNPTAFALIKTYPSRTLGTGTSLTAASPFPVQMIALLVDDIVPAQKVGLWMEVLKAGDEVTGASVEIFRTSLGVSPLVGCDAIYHPKNLQCFNGPQMTNLFLFIDSVVRLQIHSFLSVRSSAPHTIAPPTAILQKYYRLLLSSL